MATSIGQVEGKRLRMLNVVKEFLPSIERTNGVKFIGLIGSITRNSPQPKDIDQRLRMCVSRSISPRRTRPSLMRFQSLAANRRH